MTINDLHQEILKCNKCPELKNCRLYPMPGFCGNDKIKLFVIGINPGPPQPGEYERLKKDNFDYSKHYRVSIQNCILGRFMSKIFDALNITWENIYLTNLVKCATNLKLPTDAQINKCAKYLNEQVSLINPRNVLILSAFVARKIGLDFKHKNLISQNRNTFTIYHPSYLRRNGIEENTIEFFKQYKELVNGSI